MCFPKRKEKRKKGKKMMDSEFPKIVTMQDCMYVLDRKWTKPSRGGVDSKTIKVWIFHKFIIGNKLRKWSPARRKRGKKADDGFSE